MQYIQYSYDMAGKQTVVEMTGSSLEDLQATQITKTLYDSEDRVTAIQGGESENDITNLVDYTFWADSKLRYVDFVQENNHGLVYQYDAGGRQLAMQHELYDGTDEVFKPSGIFTEQMAYNLNNNVVDYRYQSDQLGMDRFRGFRYAYDHFNRLVQADFGQSTTDNADIPGSGFYTPTTFDGEYSYNQDGAITALGRGGASKVDYSYYPDANGGETHKLEKIGSSGEAIIPGGIDRSADGNYKYDLNGNKTVDLATQRVIEYDVWNMPVRITQCETMADDECTVIKSIVEYVYDASNNRVAKVILKD